MQDSFVANLVGVERVGTGELITMPRPESGQPPRRLYREVEQDGRSVRLVWEQWGDPDHSIFPYVFEGVEPVSAG